LVFSAKKLKYLKMASMARLAPRLRQRNALRRRPEERPIGAPDQDASRVVHRDDGEKDRQVSGNEGGVKIAGGEQEEKPAPFVSHQVVQGRQQEKEDQE
jgi:hypothetical protein